jgi:recombination protein RecT
MANEIVTKQMTPMQKFNAQIRGANAQDYLASVLGEKKEAFVTSLVSVVGNDSNLQKCNPMSVIYAAMKSVPLGLPIEQNLGYAAVIPYGDNASFQIMRNGWVELAMRTGQVKFIANEVVHKGELVKKNKFTGEYIFDEEKKESDEIIGYMAYIKLNNGFEKTVYWTIEECKAHALRYSQTFKKGYGIWKDNFDAMCLKTVLKNLIVKYCPKSAELQAAIRDDQTVTNASNTSTYADNQPDDQTQPQNETEAAKEKAEAVKAKVEAMKARRSAPKKEESKVEADPQTGEIFNQGK